ncbi:MAG TPA: mechanosensitive ion channel family protein [Nevskiaceae bacterium]
MYPADFTMPGPFWLTTLVTLLAAALIGGLVWWLAFFALARIARGPLEVVDRAMVRNLRAPFAIGLPLCGVIAAAQTTVTGVSLRAPLTHGLVIALVAVAAWIVVRSINAAGEIMVERHPADVSGDVRARKIETQFKVLRRISAILIGILAAGTMLITFPEVRALGATLFASAGAAGLILGLAARPVFANLFAGIQIALAQPIRIEDVVVVEGEWGNIEEINATYVVVRIWDLRRLIVPISYFIQNSYTNWTRTTANLMGTIYVYADYTVPVQALRDELQRFLKTDKTWDGQYWGLQVTQLQERVVQLRALVSAANSGDLWNIRCDVREALMTFLQREYPDCLPRTRVQMEAPGAAVPPSDDNADEGGSNAIDAAPVTSPAANGDYASP